ncbi:MAG: Gfo/Idh/MocA family protein, partial [Planctomycetota bacterium]
AYMHHDQVRICARAGKHVLCEKPLGMTIPEAEEMIESCRTAGVKLGCAFMMRFVAQHVEALKLINDGKLGKPTYARAQLSCWYPPIDQAWRQDPATGGGGSLIDMGGHCIDLLEMFFGPVSRVSCFVSNTVHDYERGLSARGPPGRWSRFSKSRTKATTLSRRETGTKGLLSRPNR